MGMSLAEFFLRLLFCRLSYIQTLSVLIQVSKGGA